jgi:VanZ family protein
VAGSFGFLGPAARRNLALGLLLFGGALELAQVVVPGRSMSLADMAANVIGVAVGLFAAVAAQAVLDKLYAMPANRGSD